MGLSGKVMAGSRAVPILGRFRMTGEVAGEVVFGSSGDRRIDGVVGSGSRRGWGSSAASRAGEGREVVWGRREAVEDLVDTLEGEVEGVRFGLRRGEAVGVVYEEMEDARVKSLSLIGTK
jgi:hypothetical protein